MKLLHKKIIWTGISMPILYNTIWAYNWQTERKIWKQDMLAERNKKLARKVEEITVDMIPFG